jgi:tyrosine-protein kinase Etk/Wzc
MESQLNNVSGQELEYGRLTRELEVNRKLYSMLKEKLEEARITEAQKVADISIVNPAFLPDSPVSGNKNIKIFIGALMGLLLGFTFAFVLEMLDTSISSIEDVEKVTQLPVLGVIPSIEGEVKEKKKFLLKIKEMIFPLPETPAHERAIRLIAHFQPQSSVAEAYRNVFTNLKPDAGKKCILVTSSGTREGKSTVTMNLGIVVAQTGLKTLLVSADLRRPAIGKIFGLEREPGLSELLTGTVDLEGALKNIIDIMVGEMSFEDIRKTPGLENLTIIPSGKLPYNPVKLLGSKEVGALIETLKRRFDVIIFDAPPVLPVTDASLLAPKMDCTVIVYENGRTSREALLRTKIQLESVNAKIAGIILNNTRSNTESMSLYPYYSRYKYRYYTKSGPSDSHQTKKEEDKNKA